MQVNKLGDLIRERLEILGIKQKDLAKELNIDSRTVTNILNATFMQTDRLERLCIYLKFNFFEFFTRPGSPLAKYGHQACEEVRKENEKLKQQVTELQKALSEAQETITHQKKLTDILSMTVEKQEQYLKEQKERNQGS